MLSLLLLFALTHAEAKAIEIEFPDEVDLPFARTSALKPLPISAKWLGASDSPSLVAWVSFGRIEHFVRTNNGYEGAWYPPDPAFPGELQIVVSTIVDGRVVFSAQTSAISAEIELAGRSEPDAEVEILMLGQAPFGPVRAAHDGRFKLLVTVPPHTQSAIARSRDRLGNTSKKTIDLFVPNVSTLALACPFFSAIAGTVRLPFAVATAKDKAGAVTVRAKEGAIVGGDYRPPQKLNMARDEITVTSALGESSCSFALLAGPAVSAETVFEPAFLLADGTSTTKAKIIARDAYGNEQPEVEAQLYEGAVAITGAIVSTLGVEKRELRALVKQKGRADLSSKVDLYQIPDRGVRLLLGETPMCVRILPTSAAVDLVAVDEAGTKLDSVAHGGEICVVAKGNVLFTHAASGQSLLVSDAKK